MDRFKEFFSALFKGKQEQENARIKDSFDLRKEKFYASYPKNPVSLPSNGSLGVMIDESHFTKENV